MISTPLSHTFSPPKHHHLHHQHSRNLHLRSSSMHYTSPIKMSSTTTIEHVVLLKVKQGTDVSKVNAMVDGLNGLSSLSQILYMTTGPVKNIRPESAFTHMFHGRIKSKFDLLTYLLHPSHVSCVINSVLPICDQVMIIDYTRPDRPENPGPGSGIRAKLVKLKEGTEEKIAEVVKTVGKHSVAVVDNSVGENFMPFVNNGYQIASVEIFPGSGQMGNPIDGGEGKVEDDYVDEMIVVDYVIP